MHLAIKSAIIIIALLPLGLLMGQLFPFGIRVVGSDDSRLVPWAWAINAAASTVSVGVGFVLSFIAGFDALVISGAALYGVILLLPSLTVNQEKASAAPVERKYSKT